MNLATYATAEPEPAGEQFRQRLFERAHVPIVVLDSVTARVVECNPAAVKIYGFTSAEELLGTTPAHVSTAVQYDGTPSSEKAQQLIAQAVADGEVVFEWRHLRPNGQVWDAEVHMLCFASGQQPLVQATLQDISLRRLTEWALRERVKELTCLYSVGRILEDRQATDETVCTGIVDFLIPAMQFPALTVPVVTVDDKCYTTDQFHDDLRHCLSAEIIVRAAPRGQIAVFYSENEPFILPEEQDLLGNLARMVGMWLEEREAEAAARAAHLALAELNRDLEQRVEERTAAVRRSEATFRALFENSNDAIFLVTPQGEDLAFNQRALNLLGYTAEEYEAVRSGGIIPPEQRADSIARLGAAVRGEEVPLYERTLIGRNGQRVEVEVNLSPVRDEEGTVIMVQSVIRDITERKKAQEELRKSRDQLRLVNAALEKAARMKDEFLASMSHELRTPLTGVLGLTEALQQQTYGALNERQLRALANIETSGRHLLDLINDILDLSKIEAGKLELYLSPCSTEDICRAALQLVKGMASQKRIQVAFSSQEGPPVIVVDARRLKQILVNLLSNAIKFTPEQGQVGLEVQGDEAGQTVRFTVWDNGIGIQPEDMDKLFQPFVLLDNSLARQQSGTGLGLALVHHMAELHGGRVEVTSAPGAGSRFAVVLPWSVP